MLKPARILGRVWSLIDRKFPRVSRPPLRILADLSNVVAWIVSVRLPIYTSFSLISKL